ncbi:hypothetical protein JCM5353_004332 [Sporobolomyces roseus]
MPLLHESPPPPLSPLSPKSLTAGIGMLPEELKHAVITSVAPTTYHSTDYFGRQKQLLEIMTVSPRHYEIAFPLLYEQLVVQHATDMIDDWRLYLSISKLGSHRLHGVIKELVVIGERDFEIEDLISPISRLFKGTKRVTFWFRGHNDGHVPSRPVLRGPDTFKRVFQSVEYLRIANEPGYQRSFEFLGGVASQIKTLELVLPTPIDFRGGIHFPKFTAFSALRVVVFVQFKPWLMGASTRRSRTHKEEVANFFQFRRDWLHALLPSLDAVFLPAFDIFSDNAPDFDFEKALFDLHYEDLTEYLSSLEEEEKAIELAPDDYSRVKA